MGSGPNVNSIVYHLASFQAPSGGFGDQRQENIEDTANALFIASFFGTHASLESAKAASFVESLHNPDGGYGHHTGAASDLESTKNAISALSNLAVAGQDVFNPTSVSALKAHILSYFDASRNLFANTKGGAGDLKSTAFAYESFGLLKLLKDKEVEEKSAAIKKALSALVKTEGGNSAFSSLTSDNFYGVFVAHNVGFQLDETWARYFVARQSQQGGFVSDNEGSEVTIVDSAHAILALHLLDSALPNTVNTQALHSYINNLAGTLESAAFAYKAIALTKILNDAFKVEEGFANKKAVAFASNQIFVQGSILRPILVLRTSFGTPLSTATVVATTTHGASETTLGLEWDAEREVYHSVEESFDTTSLTGDLTWAFALTWNVPELGLYGLRDGKVVLHHQVTKPISFWTDVKSTATYQDAEVAVEGAVGVGATFGFDLVFGTVDETPKKPLRGGAFDVKFAVLDSSLVLLHEETIDAQTTSDFHFDYTLAAKNLPSGKLTFQFTIGPGRGHTTHLVQYNLPVQMVAAEINIVDKKERYRIGDTVEVTMVPGSLVDDSLQFFGVGKREIILATTAMESQHVLTAVPSVCDSTADKPYTCTFKIELDATFDSVGEREISFYYKPVVGGGVVKLANYEASTSAPLDEPVSYFVEADLQVVNDKHKPNKGQLEYGNVVKFSFEVVDKLTDKHVWTRNNQGSGVVALALRHDKGKPTAFTSSLQAIQQVTDATGKPTQFNVEWVVNPNAVKGASALELVVVAVGGEETDLFSGPKPWSVDVEIGGTINIDKTSFSLVSDFDANFFVDFQLSTKTSKLQGADLFARVYQGGKEIAAEQVVRGPVGHYSVSWTLAPKKAPSGVYDVQVFREVDRKRLAEKAEPFFTLSLTHAPPMQSPLPFKTEVLVILLLALGVLIISFKKIEITGINKKK